MNEQGGDICAYVPRTTVTLRIVWVLRKPEQVGRGAPGPGPGFFTYSVYLA
jgi:hypothetical protein